MKKILLAALALAVAGSAAAVPQYSDLRQDYPQIDDAVAAATESDLHGTFNRLSALFHRAQIRDAAADAGFDGQLPENFARNLEATLIDLQEDLVKPQLDALTPGERIDILQVVSIMAFKRTIELWQSEEFTTLCTPFMPCQVLVHEGPCVPVPCSPVDDDPAVFNELQDLASGAKTHYTIVYNTVPVADRGPTATRPALVPPSGLSAGNYVEAVELLSLTIKGVESIDD